MRSLPGPISSTVVGWAKANGPRERADRWCAHHLFAGNGGHGAKGAFAHPHFRLCEPIGRANARPIARGNPPPPRNEKLDCFVAKAPRNDGLNTLSWLPCRITRTLSPLRRDLAPRLPRTSP